MRTAIRTVPCDSDKYPKLHNLPRRVKVWLRDDDPDRDEIRHMNNIYFAANLDNFYRERYRTGVCWSDPISCLGSNDLLVFSDEDRLLLIIRREEFEKAYTILNSNEVPDLVEEILEHKTYTPHPTDTSDVSLPTELVALSEKIAENVHDTWAQQRIKDGWRYGAHRDDSKKLSPCLVPYDKLPDSEKEYDRQTVTATIKLILKFGGKIEF